MGDEAVIFLVAGGVIALGLYFILMRKNGQKSDKPLVEATVVGFTTEQSSTSGEHPGQTTTVSTYPVYEFTLNGQTYRAEGSVGITIFTKKKYQIGAKEMIRVNPANPRRVYNKDEKNATAIIGGILVAFGLMTLLIAL